MSSLPEKSWLSVVMPVHHGERWLGETLESVAAQGSGIEVLILDSGSDQRCSAIVERFKQRLNLTYEHTPRLTSWQAKTNLGVKRATAKHVGMLHQDDLWLPNRAAELRQAIAAFPEAALFLNPSYIVDGNSARLGLWRCPLPSDRVLGPEDVAERLLVQNFISIPAPVIRRQAWIDYGGLDEQLWYTADWDLYLKLIQAGPAVYRPIPSTAFRVHDTSLTVSGSRNSMDFRQQMKIVLDRHLSLLPPPVRARVKRRAASSIAINCELAEASRGNLGAMVRALMTVLLLGPREALLYFRDSRVIERTMPRVRARLGLRPLKIVA
jgi:glycosyltransferase involved in cell wall biosynthesis